MRHTTVTIALCIALLALPFSVFFQTSDHQFINLDDPLYVTNNPYVKGGITVRNIAWAFTTTTASNWHPLTWLSHMMDVKVFGLSPRGHHLTNVIIHTASTLLLFLLLTQITAAPWQSLLAAALFALHPLHVESVAWVAERKDVLSGLFWFLTLFLYAGYVKQRTVKFYLLTLFSFVVGLMTKPMLVTLPLVMLLLDYWPLNRFQPEAKALDLKGLFRTHEPLSTLVKEKIPFFLLSLVSAVITIYAQNKGGALKSLETTSFSLRIENAVIAYAKYLCKTIWPQDLAILYPFPSSLPLWQVLISCLSLILVSLAIIRYRRCHPYLLTGWFWFLVTLTPVIGIVRVGGQSMADRYTYIPLIGLFIMCSWGIPGLMQGWRYRTTVLGALAGVTLSALIVTTWQQVGYWKDNIPLYQHTLRVTSGNYLILNNYGIALADGGRIDEAILQYQEALRIWPKSATAHVNLGAALSNQGKFTEAISHYHEALKLIPDYALAHANLGRAVASLGQVAEAMRHYERALEIDPSLSDIRLNLALLLLKSGEWEAAWAQYYTILRMDPFFTKAPINMGAALAQQGRMNEAISCFTQALQIDPESIEAHFNLGIILARLNRGNEAIQHFSHVLRVNPDVEAARHWLDVLKKEK